MTFVLNFTEKSRRINSYLKKYTFVHCTMKGNEHDDRRLYGIKNDLAAFF